MKGWICPLCARSYSPLVHECGHCNEKITKKERMLKAGIKTPENTNKKDDNERN